MASKTVTAEEICRLLAGSGNTPITPQALGQFVRAGMPKAARGSYDPIACMYWYIGRRRDVGKQKLVTMEDGQEMSKDAVEIRLTAAKADNEEMTAKERRGELIPLTVYQSEVAKLVMVVKQKMLNLPSRLAPKLEGLNRAEMKALLSASMKGCLTELAKGPDDGASPTHDTIDTAPTAAVAKRKRTRARTTRKSKPRKQ